MKHTRTRLTGRPGATAGFTLTELLIVIAVIGVLAGMIFGAVDGTIKRAKLRASQALVTSIDSAIQMFKTDFGNISELKGATRDETRKNVRLWLLGIKDNGEPDDSGANAVRDDQRWNGPYLELQSEKSYDKDNNYLLVDSWRTPICFELDDPIFKLDKWDIWSLGADLKGSEDMSAFGTGTYKKRREDYEAHEADGKKVNVDNMGNWE